MEGLMAMVLLGSLVAIAIGVFNLIYCNIKGKFISNDGNDNYEKINPKRASAKKTISIGFICIIISLLGAGIYSAKFQEGDFDKKIASLSIEDKAVFDEIYNEEIKSTTEKNAKSKALEYVKINKENLDKLNKLDEADKKYVEDKFQEYVAKNTNVVIARVRALNDLKKHNEELKAEQQKKYDDQAKYEEWIAWQKSEEEKNAKEKADKDKAEKNSVEKNQSDNSDNIINFDAIKEYASNVVNEEINSISDYATSVANNEIYVGSWQNEDWYAIPSTKKNDEHGLVFKDEGYRITCIVRHRNTAISGKEEVRFWKKGNKWLVTTNDMYEWSPLSPLSQSIFDKTRMLPNVGDW